MFWWDTLIHMDLKTTDFIFDFLVYLLFLSWPLTLHITPEEDKERQIQP